jgi:hypothetical protein
MIHTLLAITNTVLYVTFVRKGGPDAPIKGSYSTNEALNKGQFAKEAENRGAPKRHKR